MVANKNVHGVMLTDLEEMQFSKHLSNTRIAMNTLTNATRTKYVQDWLNEIRDELKNQQRK